MQHGPVTPFCRPGRGSTEKKRESQKKSATYTTGMHERYETVSFLTTLYRHSHLPQSSTANTAAPTCQAATCAANTVAALLHMLCSARRQPLSPDTRKRIRPELPASASGAGELAARKGPAARGSGSARRMRRGNGRHDARRSPRRVPSEKKHEKTKKIKVGKGLAVIVT